MAEIERPLRAAFEQGVDARASGGTLADNPFAPDTLERQEWTAGFSATFDLDEEDDPLSNRLRKEDEDPSGTVTTRRGVI